VITADRAALLTDHYRRYRERLHHLSLAGQPGFMPRVEAATAIAEVRGCWDAVFAAPALESRPL
jgi:hypothetical protein